jgi:hypothetical protein
MTMMKMANSVMWSPHLALRRHYYDSSACIADEMREEHRRRVLGE